LRVVRFSFIDARGVGRIFRAALVRFVLSNPSPLQSRAVGVGHIFACTVSEVGSVRPPPIRCFIARCAPGDFWSSRATGVPHILTVASVVPCVGHKPEPFALVGGTNGGCGEQTPFRIEPEDGKVIEDFG